VSRCPPEMALFAGLVLVLPSVSAADDATPESSSIQLMPDLRSSLEDPCKNVFEWTTTTRCIPAQLPSSSAIASPAWARFELDSLRQERSGVRVVGPSFGVAFSVLGLAAGAWLLAIGVEGAQGPRETCSYNDTWCFSRPAPYAGSALMGLSVFGMARSGKKLSQRAKRRRHLNQRISELGMR
jgi:hypothetical protein